MNWPRVETRNPRGTNPYAWVSVVLSKCLLGAHFDRDLKPSRRGFSIHGRQFRGDSPARAVDNSNRGQVLRASKAGEDSCRGRKAVGYMRLRRECVLKVNLVKS